MIASACAPYFERAVSYLPPRIAAAVRSRSADIKEQVSEIRAVKGAPFEILVGDRLVRCKEAVTDRDASMILRSICSYSLYSQSESVKEGFAVTSDGIRVGICGRAVTEAGRIVNVADISGFVIRIPVRCPGMADELYSLMAERDFSENALVFSPPSGGKTTLLRELIVRLTDGEDPKRVAVVDTRFELSEGVGDLNCFFLKGYPRAKGMEIALRTLSPDVLICDEISGDEDLSALRYSVGCGVTVVASCHAGANGLFSRKIVRQARAERLFGIYYGIVSRSGPDVVSTVVMAEEEQAG